MNCELIKKYIDVGSTAKSALESSGQLRPFMIFCRKLRSCLRPQLWPTLEVFNIPWSLRQSTLLYSIHKNLHQDRYRDGL